MIGRLSGRVVHEEATGAVVLDVAGVGYELLCPVGTLGRSGDGLGGVTLHVHTNLRQDALELFGFASAEERSAFRQLIAVPNVGPRIAIAVLSALPAAELAQVVDAEDKLRLANIPGIGKKTSERLVLELRGKLAHGHEPGRLPAANSAERSSSKLVLALVGLGYKPAEAERAARAVGSEAGEADLGALLRKALQFLAS